MPPCGHEKLSSTAQAPAASARRASSTQSSWAEASAMIEAITAAVKARSPKLPFLKMVHLLLQGPVPYVEAGLQDRIMAYSIFSGGDVRKAANEGRAYYLPCTLANLDSLIGKGRRFEPDVVFFKVSRNPFTGEFSMGLSVEALHTAIDHARVVIAELDPSMPFTEGQSSVDASSIDYLIQEGIKPVYELPAPDFNHLSPQERRIGELIAESFIQDGVTLQVGIGKIPDAVVATIKNAGYRDLGVQTELYGDGLMILQEAGIVTNRHKKANQGYSTTSLIMGSRALYDFVHMRTGVQMRPSAYTNSAETVRKNSPFVSVNTALGVAMDPPARVAYAVQRLLERDRAEAFVGWPERLFVKLNALLPGLVDRSLRKQLPVIARYARGVPSAVADAPDRSSSLKPIQESVS